MRVSEGGSARSEGGEQYLDDLLTRVARGDQAAFEAVYDTATGKHPHAHEFMTYNTPGVSKATVDQCVGQW